MFRFSTQARSLWAKKSRNGDFLWLSLPVHLDDAAETARLLWRKWVPSGVKRVIGEGMDSEDDGERLFVFVAAAHDCGKATPAFAVQECGYRELDERIREQILDSGLPLERKDHFPARNRSPHALASQILLQEAGCPESVAVVLGAHHGKPPDSEMLKRGSSTYAENYYMGRSGKLAWQSVQNELIAFALWESGYRSLSELPKISVAAQVLLSGLIITVDWITSDCEYFPYLHLEDPRTPDSKGRAMRAWDELGFSIPWKGIEGVMIPELYQKRFGFVAKPVQQTAIQVACQIRTPGIVVLEAPMGVGKTEAALAMAEVFANTTGRRGVFFALPSQATSDGIFPRMLDWVNKLTDEDALSLRLVHGKAQFNSIFTNLADGTGIAEDEEMGVYVHEWFAGRKRSMLDDFVVGTIDQLLMAGLKQKHVMLRHLGLSNKVIVIDEAHAYDAYMDCYLHRVLNWLGAYQLPVIVLSATLPAEKRRELVDAYRNTSSLDRSGDMRLRDPLGRRKAGVTDLGSKDLKSKWNNNLSYPLITYTDGQDVKQQSVSMNEPLRMVSFVFMDENALAAELKDLLTGGGCIGVIVNTVRRAQQLAVALIQQFGIERVRLLHSRFMSPDRIEKESELMMELGKPGKNTIRPNLRIIVGTQILEQSLDIDFDLLVTDICPMDLLLQRIGRLHRHNRQRPPKLHSAICIVIGLQGEGFESGASSIYGDYLLMRTKARLPERLSLPDDIPMLVQDVYNSQCLLISSEEYQLAEAKHQKMIEKKQSQAATFRIEAPTRMNSIVNWLNTDVSDQKGEATVRDTEDSLEVLMIMQTSQGDFCFLPWVHGGIQLDAKCIPGPEISKQLARCSIRLPTAVCGSYGKQFDETIRLLERSNIDKLSAWQNSSWLKGQLFLILDANFSANIREYHLKYDKFYGLEYEKEGGRRES